MALHAVRVRSRAFGLVRRGSQGGEGGVYDLGDDFVRRAARGLAHGDLNGKGGLRCRHEGVPCILVTGAREV
jgi:hypothetical protein